MIAKRLFGVLAFVLLLTQLARAQPVSTFPPANLPLSGAELMYLIQGGVSKQSGVGNMPGAIASPIIFTGDPSGVVAADSAYTAWLAAMKTTHKPGYAPPGTYRFVNQTFFDVGGVVATGVHISGAGCNATVFSYTGAASPAFRLGTDTLVNGRGDNFFSSIKGIGFAATVVGPVLQLGRNDMLDPINGGQLDVCVNNSSTNASQIGVKVNGWIDSPFTNMVVSGPSAGTSCYIDGAAFSNFFGSCSGGDTGILLTGTAAQAVFGNIFHAMDLEVNSKDIIINSVGGVTASKNTFIGGQYDYNTRAGPCAIDGVSGAYNLFINPNLGASTDFCGTVGVQVIGDTAKPVTLETFVNLGLTVSNGVAQLPNLTGLGSGITANAAGIPFSFQNDTSGNGYIINSSPTAPIQYEAGASAQHTFYVGASVVGQFTAAGLNTTGALLSGLPTSCSAKPTGTVWKNGTVLNICP